MSAPVPTDPTIARLVDELADQRERLRRLEEERAGLGRRLRRVRAIALGAVVLAGGMLALGMRAPNDVVQAKRFVLASEDGTKVRAELKSRDGSPRLALYDDAGKGRLVFAVSKSGVPLVNFTDADGSTRLAIALGKSGAPSLTMLDQWKTSRVQFGMSEGGASALSFADKDGDKRFSLTVGVDAPGMIMADAEGRTRVSMAVAKDGMPMILLRDDQKKNRILLAVSAKDGTPFQRFYDADGKATYTLPKK